jgi:hypothetical protein
VEGLHRLDSIRVRPGTAFCPVREEVRVMSKPTVTKLFLSSVVAVVAGIVLGFAAVWYAYINDAFVMNGPDVVGIQATPEAWGMVGLAFVAALTIAGGFIGGLVSWIGALLNTAQLKDKTWFILLLVFGLLSFGFVAMIAYVIGGPDGTERKDAPIGAITAATSTVVMNPKS